MRRATGLAPARRLRRLFVGLVLVAVAAVPAAGAAAPRDLSLPAGFATYPLSAVRSPGVPSHELWFATRVDNPPSQPTFTWTVDPPPGHPECKTFTKTADQVFKESGTTTYASEIHLQIGTAAGCPPDGAEGGSDSFEGTITVTIAMGALTCTVGTTGPLTGQCSQTGGGSKTGKPPTASKTSKATAVENAVLKRAANLALTFELQQLPVLLHKPHIRKAIFTHFTSQTRALIDRKLKQKKIAQAEQAKTHARLQRELRQGWKKVWDVRAQLESYKDLCNRYVDAYDTVGKFEALVSAGLASVPGGALFLPLTMGMGGAARIAGAEWGRNAADPPDRHYTALVTPTTPTFPAIPAAQGVPAGLVDAATTFLADDGKAIGLVTAFRRSFERAQGAAAAGNAAWTARQLGAAATFADSAAAALGSLPADLTALRQQLGSAAGVPLGSAQSAAVAKLGAAAAPDRLLPALAASTTKAAAALRALGIRLKALATA